ncbi:MAG: GNAT family N-acetyltransferase [Spirochaetes bacterium]|nr:GNAT family N-acetyltransferase [Spirochaetota bacterium]
MLKDWRIREIANSEVHLLEDFVYEAIFQRDEKNLIPRDVLKQPEIKIYYEDFGKPDDICFVTEIEGKIIGIVWTRILSGKVRGFGNIDSHTPEFGISLYKEYRGKGIGTALMKYALSALKKRGYKRTSLSVQKDNPAVKMYQNVGFSISKETEEEYLMVCELAEDSLLTKNDHDKMPT